jgi:hypothetical protein
MHGNILNLDWWKRVSKSGGISNSLDGSEDSFIWYSDDNCMSAADDDDSAESNGEKNAVGT